MKEVIIYESIYIKSQNTPNDLYKQKSDQGLPMDGKKMWKGVRVGERNYKGS